MDLGVHLPLLQFGDEPVPPAAGATVDAAVDCGFAAVSANDHLVFQRPWLDGLSALATVVGRSGELTLATTISLAVVRGPVPLAKALTALDVLSEGRLIAGVGPGSSGDYRVVGIPFEERWTRFDEAVAVLRALLRANRCPSSRATTRFRPMSPSRPAHGGRTGFHSGSEAGARRRAWRAWRGRRRVARLRVQHHAGAVRRRPCRARAGTSGPRAGSRRVPERARDDVDLGIEEIGRRATGC